MPTRAEAGATEAAEATEVSEATAEAAEDTEAGTRATADAATWRLYSPVSYRRGEAEFRAREATGGLVRPPVASSVMKAAIWRSNVRTKDR